MVVKSRGARRGGYTEFARFATVHQRTSSSLVAPQSQDQRLGGQRLDPGAPISLEAGDTRRDHEACVGRKQDCSKGMAAHWEYPSFDHISIKGCVSSFKL
jgi:hypothetical protein